jgi:hypothetical protein
MKITEQKLKELNACQSGIDWFNKQKTTNPKKLFNAALKEYKYGDINWVLTHLMNKKQKVTYAIFAAELVIDIFESKYPNDKTAKAYLKNPCKKTNAYAAAAAAADDAYAYAYTAAAAAYAAYAADAAAADAAAAYAAAAYAADAAYAYAAADDADAADARKEMYIKILTFGFKLLTGDRNDHTTKDK